MADEYEREQMPGIGEVLFRHKVTSPRWLMALMTGLPLGLWGDNARAVHIDRTDGGKLVVVMKEPDEMARAVQEAMTRRDRKGARVRVEAEAEAEPSEAEIQREEREAKKRA